MDEAHRSPEVLQRASRAVLMEYRMLGHTYAHLQRLDETRAADPVEKNVFLESFLIHARNLIDFLSSRGSLPTDVLASDYLSGHAGQPDPEGLRSDINHRLAHITTRRQHLVDREWPLSRMYDAIHAAFNAFVTSLAARHRDQAGWFTGHWTDGQRVHNEATSAMPAPLEQVRPEIVSASTCSVGPLSSHDLRGELPTL